MMQRSRRRWSRRGQQAVEVVVIAALIALAMTWLTTRLHQALTRHYRNNQMVMASPL